jgi:Holliday junction DNA helicase RuvA
MISYIKGTILYKTDEGVVVNNNDLGFHVSVPEKRIDRYTAGQTVEFYTHEHIREDARELYGFDSPTELDFFLQLISISGVGPKLAMKIFALGAIEKIKKAVNEENVLLLSTVPGVGKKTAQKIILELRGKLTTGFGLAREDQDVLEALTGLGYEPSRVREMLKDLPETAQTSEEKIKAALKLLGKNKTLYR